MAIDANVRIMIIRTFRKNSCYCLDMNQCFTQSLCQNGGTCLPGPGNTFTCQCSYPYSGTYCEQTILPSSITPEQFIQMIASIHSSFFLSDPCASMPCRNNATCLTLNGNQQYYCYCASGFTGTTCSKKQMLFFSLTFHKVNFV